MGYITSFENGVSLITLLLQEFGLMLALIVFAYMTTIFILSLIKKDNGIVDIAWGPGFVLLAAFPLFYMGNYKEPVPLLLFTLIVIWGSRLALRIYRRGRGKPEDFRYKAWRESWGRWFYIRSFFQIYMLQGLLMLLMMLPVVFASLVPSYDTLPGIIVMTLGILVWITGFYFEARGDYELDQYMQQENRPEVLKTGLWRYTRHPNYFGEVTLWWGIFLIVMSTGFMWWAALLTPAIITILILFVSGIPMLEKKLRENEAYQEYMEETNAFFPWAPRT